MPMTGELLEGAAPFAASNGSTGVLVLHGFTGSPQSVRSLAEAFADAGFAVELPLLPGHGTKVEDLLPLGFPDWSAAAEAAYLDLAARSDRIIVAGLSMGGTLACWLAQHHGDLAGLVLINPLVEPPAESAVAALRAQLAAGTTLLPAIGSDIARPGATEVAYDATPLAPLLSLFEATPAIATRLAEVVCPVLLFSSHHDHVVPPSSADLVERAVSGPVERVRLERSYHVATLDFDAAELEHRAVGFATKVASP